MADFLGIQYNPSATQVQIRNQFTSSLSQEQLQQRTNSISASKAFEGKLTPDQRAAQQKWRLEKLEGAPPSEWKADRQAFLASLTPQEQADRNSAMTQRQAFLKMLSPEQQDLHGAMTATRDANILQASPASNSNMQNYYA